MAVTSGPRLYIRSPFARVVYNKLMEDQRETSIDHSYWYNVNLDSLPEDIADKFVQCHEDGETRRFIKTCQEKSDWLFTQLLHTFVKFVFSWFMTNTSINGMLKRGSMFVISQEQFQTLLNVDASWKTNRLLDLGAGDGMVTRQMAHHFDEVYATEASETMKWRLQEHGFKVIGIDEWSVNNSIKYDVISCLNLLDRCDKPLNVLQQIQTALTPITGRLVLAVVFPFRPYVEFGNNNNQPDQFLHIEGQTFEEQLTSFVRDVLNPAGFILERFSRVPYLCEGDLHHSFYVLYDAILILKSVHVTDSTVAEV